MIRLADIVGTSVVDGKGIRTVVFLQGCTRNCPGCHNPQLQPLEGGKMITEEKLARMVLAKLSPLHRGVTFSGGEPLQQAGPLYRVIELIKKERPEIDIWVYTGYTYDEVQTLPVLELVDVLVDGVFILEQRDLDLPFRGSTNQRLIDLPATKRSGRVVELEIEQESETRTGMRTK